MIELLVVIAIATIGVVYTSSTGEAESNIMADKSAKDALNEAEGQSGIGILGIDVVARKMRKVVGLRAGAVSAASIAEFRAGRGKPKADMDDEDAEMDDEYEGAYDMAGADHDDLDPRVTAQDEDESDWADDWDEDAELAAAEEEDWGDDWADDDLSEHAVVTGSTAEDARPVARDYVAEAREAPVETWQRDAVEDRKAAAPAATAGIDTAEAPIVDDFDPKHDQILIGYRPGEAGNGRIGIIEDPLRPGSAAVTLGGRCVAVVQDGFGKVRAHHIDLVCEEDNLAA